MFRLHTLGVFAFISGTVFLSVSAISPCRSDEYALVSVYGDDDPIGPVNIVTTQGGFIAQNDVEANNPCDVVAFTEDPGYRALCFDEPGTPSNLPRHSVGMTSDANLPSNYSVECRVRGDGTTKFLVPVSLKVIPKDGTASQDLTCNYHVNGQVDDLSARWRASSPDLRQTQCARMVEKIPQGILDAAIPPPHNKNMAVVGCCGRYTLANGGIATGTP